MRILSIGSAILIFLGFLGAITYPHYEDLDIYQVRSGDTLWDLSGWYLGNNWLWPYIYQANSPYLADPVYRNGLIIVWIYPGDHLILPYQVVRGQQFASLFTPDKKEYAGYVDWPNNYEKYGEIVREDFYEIAKDEQEQDLLTSWDPFYLDRGSNNGVKVEDSYWIFSVDKTLRHPVTKKNLGAIIRIKGVAEVYDVYERVSRLRIIKSFDPINVGDRLMPWEQTRVPAFKAYEKAPNYNEGYVIGLRGIDFKAKGFKEEIEPTLDATFDPIYIDKGTRNGVGDGDVFEVYRPESTVKNRLKNKIVIPVTVIAKLLVINARAETSTCYVSCARTRNIAVGDHVRHVLKAVTFYPDR